MCAHGARARAHPRELEPVKWTEKFKKTILKPIKWKYKFSFLKTPIFEFRYKKSCRLDFQKQLQIEDYGC